VVAVRYDRLLQEWVFGPGLRLLCGLSGRSNFFWARVVLVLGLVAMVAGNVLGTDGVGFGALVGLMYVYIGGARWGALGRLERWSRAISAEAVPPAVVRDLRVVRAGRCTWFSLSLLSCALMMFLGPWNVLFAVGFLFFASSGFWGLDFVPPGRGLLARAGTWMRAVSTAPAVGVRSPAG
jgi:hypothetical protein